MAEKKIVLLDIDSTLNNFQEYFRKVFFEKHPQLKDQFPPDVTHIDVLKVEKAKCIEIFNEDGFSSRMEPLPGAVDGVHELVAKGYDVFFCTSLVTDDCTTLNDRVQWIGRYFGKDYMGRVIFAKDKSLIRGDFLIDDSPMKSCEKGLIKPEWKLIIFDMSYNKDDKCYGRISNWTDTKPLYELLERKD